MPIADEINIQNNKQVFYIQVLKNIYRVAIITGAPNFNTQFLKNIFLIILRLKWIISFTEIIFTQHH